MINEHIEENSGELEKEPFFAENPLLFRSVAIVLTALVLITVALDLKKSILHTVERPLLRPDVRSVLKSDVDGNFPLVGLEVREFYPPTVVLVVPPHRREWQKYFRYFRLNFHSLGAYAYPVSVRRHNYNGFLSSKSFEKLKSQSDKSFRGFNYVCYLVRENGPNDKMGLFMYRDNFAIAPIDTMETEGNSF